MRRTEHTAGRGNGKKELRLLEKLAQAMIRKQEMASVMQNLAEGFVKEFGFRAAFVSRFDDAQNGFTVLGIAPRTRIITAVARILRIRLDRYVFPFQPDKNRVARILLGGKTWIGNDMTELLKPVFSTGASRLLQKILRVKCFYNAPLFSGKDLLGSVLVCTHAGSFTAEQRSFLRAVTHHAALVLHQTRVLAENKSKTRQYRLLSQVDSHIMEQKQLQRVLKAIVRNIHHVISCDLAGIYLNDPVRRTMMHSVAWPQNDYARKLKNLEFPLGSGVIGSIARSRKAEIINNAHEDPRSVYPRGARPGLEHLLCLPLIANRRLLGILHVGRFHDEPFEQGDLEIAQRFAEKSALAVENAQLFARQKEREKDLEGLQQSGAKIAESLDLHTVLKRILAEARKIVPTADGGSVALVEEESKDLVVAAETGVTHRPEGPLRMQWGRGVAGKVAKTLKSMVVDDVSRSRVWIRVPPIPGKQSARSVVAFPLIVKSRAIGVLNLDSTVRTRAFTTSDVSRLEVFAQHAALAIRNAQLHASLEHEIKKIKLLRDIKTLVRGGSSTAVFLRDVCRLMVEAYDYTLTTILLYDPVRQVLRLVAASGSEAPRIPSDYQQTIQDGVVGWVARSKNLRLVQDASKDKFFVNRNGLSTRAELCVPILDANRNLLGVINTESSRRNAFRETDVQTQSAVAAEIAGAFEEQRLLAALSDSERKFRRLFEESKDAIYISTPDGVILDANQAAVELFGYEAKEDLRNVVIRRDLYQVPGDRDDLVKQLEGRGFLKDVELKLKRKNDEQLLVHATITSIRDGTGKTIAYQGILHDITKRKEGERRLHESEEKYRSLVEDALVGVYIIQEGRFSFVNSKFAEIFGYTVDQVLTGHLVEDFVHPDDRFKVMENIQKRMVGEVKSLRYGFRGIHREGRTIEVEVFGTRSIYQGRVAVIGTLLDRTQEQHQQREIDEWKRRYDLIIASSGQVVYEYNVREGTILWGGSIESVLGYRLDELKGDIQEREDFVHPQDRERALHELDGALRTKKPYDLEYRYRRKDGTYVWMHDRGFVVDDESGWAKIMLGMMEDITKARELEARVQFSELKHRLLFEHANDAVLVLRGDLITDCNPRAHEMFGCLREDLIGQTLHAFTPPHQMDGTESKARLLEHIQKGLEGIPRKFSWRHIRRDGSPFEAAVRLTRFELAGETLLQVQVRDITAEVEAREELARSEETYRRLVLEASDPILVTDGNGRLVEVNGAACRLLGYSREELLRCSIADLFESAKEVALAEYRKFYARLISEERAAISDQVMKRKDGSTFPYEMSAALLGNGLLQAIIRDVSRKKQAEGELDRIYTLATTFRGMELFEKAASTLGEMLSMHYVSVGEVEAQTIRSLTFYRQGQFLQGMVHSILGSPCERILSDRTACYIERDVPRLFPKNDIFQEWKIEAFIGVPMLDNRREVIGIVTLMDTRAHAFSEHEKKIISIIAQRLASELEMLAQRKREEQLSEQLVQSQKMESLGTLAGGVAHDFNNILGAVIGYISLIKKRIDGDGQTAKYLDAIEKSAQRAASLSKQLLSFSHKTHGEINPVAVNELVQDTIHIIASSFPKNIVLQTRLGENLPSVLGDPNLLGQVVMNLCINARDAVREQPDRRDGIITVTTSVFHADAGFIDLHLSAAPGDYVCLTVKDNGVGMRSEVRTRIFEPFFTTKGKGRGTGLGLSMVYGIVRNHNGFVDVHTEENQGTEFRVFLPAAHDERRGEEVFSVDLPRGNGEVIMIVEDEPMLRELVADVLSAQGYGVVLAANGREAVDLYESDGERVSLVILDMIMPEMDGQATFKALRSLNPTLRVLISSGFAQDGRVQGLLSDGAAGFVGKPYQTDELLKAVSKYLRN